MIIIYVDDMMVIGHKESIIDVQERVEKVSPLKQKTTSLTTLVVNFT